VIGAMCALGATLDTAMAATAATTVGEVVAEEVLLLGPLPASPSVVAATSDSTTIAWGTIERVPEVGRPRGLPQAGATMEVASRRSVSWRNVAADPDRGVAIGGSGAGVYWLVARLEQDRWAEITIRATAATDLWVDGERIAGADDGPDELSGTVAAHRGARDVWVRTERRGGDGIEAYVRITAAPASTEKRGGGKEGGAATEEAEPAADGPERDAAAGEAKPGGGRPEPAPQPVGLRWRNGSEPLHDYDASRDVAVYVDLAIAPDGGWCAARWRRRHDDREGWRSRVDVFDRRGDLIATDVGGSDARPVTFTPDGGSLLLRRDGDGDSGTDLLLWKVPSGPITEVVHDEPDLELVRFSSDGAFLLLASSRGFEPRTTEEDEPHRFLQPRQRVTDFDPGPHLHLVDVASGLRRRLTLPGDAVIDDAVFDADGRSVIYGRTVPQAEHPWFHSEIRRLDLAGGADTLVATFTAGWEVRPHGFALHPDGQRLAFVGPPEEVGGEHTARNVYHQQIWLLDLTSGARERLAGDTIFSFESGGNLPRWDAKGRVLTTLGRRGATMQIVALGRTESGWLAQGMTSLERSVASAVLAPEGGSLLFTASAPSQLPALFRQEELESATLLAEPNAELQDRWLLAEAADASFTGPGGEKLEAWTYLDPPVLGGSERPPNGTPLIVYYYGGAVPVERAFNALHQFWWAQGYALLVINTRGAAGYGEAFARNHAGDWGPVAAADVLAGVDAFLSDHSEIDPDRVGIYGGSYGGFLTEYLLGESDRFAAAVALYGISDLATYWGQGAWGWTYGDMALAGRTPWHEPQYFVEHSPLYRADRMRTPLLLLHGEADSNVTPGESVQLFTALAVQGREVELVTFPGEDHGISGTWSRRVDHRMMILEWFDRFLCDRPQAWRHRWR
jgi:dipeptidyl aminopeptidase/acylaminoacyl peptidase